MANMEGFRAADMRESNEKLVKRFLMEYGECTKMDIAGGLGLSHPTVAKVLADMAARGEAESAGKEDSLGGRSGEKYRLNYNYTHVLAIILTLDRLQYRVVNLARRTKEEGSLPVVGQTHIARMAELVSDVRGRFPNIRLIELGMSGTVLDGRLLYISQADFYLVGSDVAGELEKLLPAPGRGGQRRERNGVRLFPAAYRGVAQERQHGLPLPEPHRPRLGDHRGR